MITITQQGASAEPNVLTIPAAIMNIGCNFTKSLEYKLGHRDARHAAADLVLARADELKALAAQPAAPVVPEGYAAPTATHGPLHLTNRKTAEIASTDYNIVGYVLRREDGDAVCISAESAVRWLPQAHYWRLMHEQDGSLFAERAPAPQAEQVAKPTAWLATDLDGRGDVAFTKEEAIRRAGEGCVHLFPLVEPIDLAAAPERAAAPAEQAEGADKRDAERYRHIKADNRKSADNTFCLFLDLNGNLLPVASADMDAEIDAARATHQASAPTGDSATQQHSAQKGGGE